MSQCLESGHIPVTESLQRARALLVTSTFIRLCSRTDALPLPGGHLHRAGEDGCGGPPPAPSRAVSTCGGRSRGGWALALSTCLECCGPGLTPSPGRTTGGAPAARASREGGVGSGSHQPPLPEGRPAASPRGQGPRVGGCRGNSAVPCGEPTSLHTGKCSEHFTPGLVWGRGGSCLGQTRLLEQADPGVAAPTDQGVCVSRNNPGLLCVRRSGAACVAQGLWSPFPLGQAGAWSNAQRFPEPAGPPGWK